MGASGLFRRHKKGKRERHGENEETSMNNNKEHTCTDVVHTCEPEGENQKGTEHELTCTSGEAWKQGGVTKC